MSMSIQTSSTSRASEEAVLAFAWNVGEFTATDAMAATGLTRATAIDAVDALIERGLIEELANAREAGTYTKGRPARRFALRDGAAVLVGVDAGDEHLVARVTDLRSKPLATVRATLPRAGARRQISIRQQAIVDLVDRALNEAGADRAHVLSLSIGVPAPVNSEGRSPSHPEGFWELMNPGLIDLFSWAPIARIENDASLAAVAEGSVGAAVGCQNYVTLLAGWRLGAGVVVDGRLLRGAHGGVGEMVAFDHVVGVGTAFGLGVRIAEWAEAAVAEGRAAPDSALATLAEQQFDARAVLSLAAQGDPAAVEVVERVGVMLARVVSVLGSMFDPERVVITGGIAAGVEVVAAAARRALQPDLHLPAPELHVSTIRGDVVVAGAVAAAAQAASEHILAVWDVASADHTHAVLAAGGRMS